MSRLKYLCKFACVTVFFLLIFSAETASAQVVISEPNDSVEYGWSPSVSFNDYNSTCEYSYDASSYVTINCANGGSDIPAPVANGTYTLYVRGFDGSNNQSEANFSFEFQAYGCTDSNALNYNADATIDDSSCYYIGINSPGSGEQVNSWNPSVSWGNFSPNNCYYSFDGGTYYDVNCGSGGTDIPAPDAVGSVTLYVQSNGSIGPYITSVGFTYDPTVASVTINSPVEGNSYNPATWSPSVNYYDYNSTCEYSYDSANWYTLSCGSNGSDIPAPPDYGQATLYVRGFDNVSSETSDSATFTYDAGVTYGCTDGYAINYNSSATSDDGSCYYISIDSPVDGSSYSSWSPSINWGVSPTSCEYTFGGSYNSVNCGSYGSDIPDPGDGYWSLTVKASNPSQGTVSASSNFTLSYITNYGCTDSYAINYDSNANSDDGSCYYILISDPQNSAIINSWTPSINFGVSASDCAYNFNNNSWINVNCSNNGSDIPDPGYGSYILNIRAYNPSQNYVYANSSFTYDSGVTYGCTDSVAINYNANANADDGSCYYILINSPTGSEVVMSWNPSVNWGIHGPGICEYSYDNSTWNSVSCTSAGSDIASPGTTGSVTLYVKSTGPINPSTSVTFTYNPATEVSISSPVANSSIISWDPSVNWGSYTSTCEYSYDNSSWQSVSCLDSGNDINSPSEGSATLYIRGSDGSNYSYADVSFTYNQVAYGCTNNLAINYSSNATADDGSCYYVNIESPIEETITSWSPVVNWGIFSPSLCQYTYNSGVYVTVGCGNAGSDIVAPEQGSNILYIRASNSALGRGPYTDAVSFTYNEGVSISSPAPSQVVPTWSPVVDWGSYSIGCEYSYDGSTYYSIASCTTTPAIPEPGNTGAVTLYIRGTDGSLFSEANVSFDYAPRTATPSLPDLDTADDTGVSNTDNLTSQYSSLTIRGNSTYNTVVTVCKNGCSNEILGSFTVTDGDGFWAYDLPTLADGVHSITVKYRESGGSDSYESNSLVITVDTTAPAAPGTPDLQSVYDTGYSNTDNITMSDTGVFDIACENGATVTLGVNNTSNRSVACVSGVVSATLIGTMSEASYTIDAIQTDLAGNTSDRSASVTVVRDATAPVISSVASTTSDTSASVTWNTNENASSTVEYGLTTGYGSIVSSSSFVTSHALNISGLTSASTYNFRVSATDAAGNRSVSTNRVLNTTVTPDTTSPTLQSAVVNGDTLTLVFSEALSATSTPIGTTFTINGSTSTVSSVSISGTTVTLTLSAPVVSTQVITISYTVPLTGTLQDSSGNTVVAFSNRSVTNQTPSDTVEVVQSEEPRVGAVAVATQGGFNSYSFAPRPILVIGSKASGQFGPAVYVTGVVNETTGAPMNNGYGGLTNTFAFGKNAVLGTRNDEVVNLQRFLNAQGFRVNTVDGSAGSPGYETNFFGSLTRKALAEFQKIVGITPVGYFGPKTRAFINNFLEKNAPTK